MDSQIGPSSERVAKGMREIVEAQVLAADMFDWYQMPRRFNCRPKNHASHGRLG